jgi:hypothetical protein
MAAGAKSKAAPEPTLAQLADELGTLKKEWEVLTAPFALKKPRLEALEKKFRALCPAAENAEWRVQGARFEVVLSPRALWRSVDIPKLFKLVKAAAFLRIASVTLAALDAECAPEVVTQVVSQRNSGPRTLRAYEKGAAA